MQTTIIQNKIIGREEENKIYVDEITDDCNEDNLHYLSDEEYYFCDEYYLDEEEDELYDDYYDY